MVGTITYKGKDGFIKMGVITGRNGGIAIINNTKKILSADNIDNVAKKVIKNSSMKNNFTITFLKIDSQNARLIIPTGNNQSEAILLVKYPNNIRVITRGILFDYFQVKADKKHIKNIVNSIKFIS